MRYFDGIFFNAFGEVSHCTQFSLRRAFNGYYGIQFTYAGKFAFRMDDGAFSVTDGPCAFLSRPGHVYDYGSWQKEPRMHFYVCFSGPRAEAFQKGGLLDFDASDPVVRISGAEQFLATVRELLRYLRKADASRPGSRSVLLLEDLLLQLQEQPAAARRPNPFCENHILQLRERITADPRQDWNFEAEAAKLSISVSHFRRLFREITGNAPNRFLTTVRLNQALDLLQKSDLSIAEISHRCGFPDEFYFSRLFRQYRRLSPREYRKEFR